METIGKAYKVRDLMSGRPGGYAALYRVIPPLQGHSYMIASAIPDVSPLCAMLDDFLNSLRGPMPGDEAGGLGGSETYLFASDVDGAVTDWSEIRPGSYKGGMNHAEAFNRAGYDVAGANEAVPQ